jgi:hypothetical protein
MIMLPTETRPGEKVSWRRVLVAFTFAIISLGALAGFFISFAGADSMLKQRLTAATALVFRTGSDSLSQEGIFVAIGPEVSRPVSVSGSSEKAEVPRGVEKKPAPAPASCPFSGKGVSAAPVRFSEIAWMGTPENGDAEWIELANQSGGDVALARWRVQTAGGSISQELSPRTILPANGLFLLERESDAAVPQKLADHIFRGRLSNTGEHLRIFDSDCRIVDEVNAGKGWKPIGGDTITKRTAERRLTDGTWRSSLTAGGSPGSFHDEEENILPVVDAADGIVYISEVMAGRDGAASYEFIELYNASDEVVDLTGWSLKKRSATGAESTLVSPVRLEGLKIQPKKHLLLANEAGYSGPVRPDVIWPKSYTLSYKSNGVELFGQGGKVDGLDWAELPAGKSLVRWSVGDKGLVSEPEPQNLNSN